MDLSANGKLLCSMRKARGMTQKQVAEKLGVMPKTVSKWETGHGFPDTSLLADLSRVLGVSVDSLLSGALSPNPEEVGNFKKIRFYVCPHCGSMMQGMGECRLSCCGVPMEPLKASENTAGHRIKVERVEDDFYITFEHEMTKEHYISFVSYVSCDRVLTVKLYPEQDCSARFPVMYGGKFYYYCSSHGLFGFDERGETYSSAETASLTALVSAFSRAYVNEHSNTCMYRDALAKKLFSPEEYLQMEQFMSMGGNSAAEYVYTNLAPTPLARSRYCEDSLNTAVMTGTSQYVVFDFADSHLFSSDAAQVMNMLAMAEKSGEPMQSCFGYGELEKMLEKHSFLIYEFLNCEEIQDRYFTECNNEMTAFENVNFAQAVLYNKNN